MISIRTMQPDDWAMYRDLRLRSLADSPDSFCSTLAAEQGRTPEDWAARLSAAAASGRDCPLVAELAGEPVGLVWAKVDGDDPSAVNLYQMWVAPESRGRGVAASLLRTATDWARSTGARVARLGVIGTDTAAARLYLREGFRYIGEPMPAREGSPLLTRDMERALV